MFDRSRAGARPCPTASSGSGRSYRCAMKRVAVAALLGVGAVVSAGCGAGGQQHTAARLVSIRFCGPFDPAGRPVTRGCALQRVPATSVSGAPEQRAMKARADQRGDGRLTGFVAVCGDPLSPRSPSKWIPCALQEGHVEVRTATGLPVARQQLSGRGRFAIELPPGRYRLITWLAGNGPWQQSVYVLMNETTTADVVSRAI
jgi:hypothetical protein